MTSEVQTSYTRYQPTAQVGTRASMHNWDIDSKLVEAPSIPFGRAVSQSQDVDEGCHLGMPSGRRFIGLSVANPTLSHDTPDQYEEGDTAGIMVSGDLWVEPDGAVDPKSDPRVYVNELTGELGPSGISNATLLTNARFMTSNDVETFVVVRVGAVDVNTGA